MNNYLRLFLGGAIGAPLISVAALVSGCAMATPKETADDTASLGRAAAITAVATSVADAAASNTDTVTRTLLSGVKANVVTARSANQGNTPGPAQTVVDAELAVAEQAMRDVPEDPKALAAAAERRALVEAGKADEAREAYRRAEERGKQTADALGAAKEAERKAKEELALARAAEATARAEFFAQLEENRKANEQALKDLEAKHALDLAESRNQVMRDQVALFNRIGAGSAGAAVVGLGLVFWFGGIVALRKIGPLLGLLFLSGLACFGLAQILGLWWFKWAVLVSVAAGLSLAVWWAVHMYRDGRLKEELDEKTRQLTAIVHDVVPVLDHAYENAEDSVRELLDARVFNPLSRRMDESTKEQVRKIRAVAPKVTA